MFVPCAFSRKQEDPAMKTSDALRQILTYADDKPLLIPANTFLEPEQEHLANAYIVEQGLIIQGYYNRSGDRQICRVYRPGDVFGLESLDGGLLKNSPPLVSETLSDCQVMRLPLTRLRQQQSSSLSLAQVISHLLSREVIASHYWKINIGSGPAISRICRFLLWVAHRDRCIVPPRDKLGSIVSVTTETASRTIANLRRQGCLLPFEYPQRDHMRIDRTELLRHAGEFWDNRAA
jgi:CRP-like cAMP-binding protein|tara:strand:+ start:3798 stop:4502 length:705 start_codon:yes stop_codon:yes gene_type:complete